MTKTKRVSGYMRRERVDPFAEIKRRMTEQLRREVEDELFAREFTKALEQIQMEAGDGQNRI